MKLDHLLLATSNQGKVREIRTILEGFAVRVSSAGELGISVEIEEKGETYRENALAKARALLPFAHGLPVLADDSGLEVAALRGRPGVLSARYGGAGVGDAGRVTALLAELAGVPDRQRGAEFCCVAVIVFADGREVVAEGRVAGMILDSPRGRLGFGYDPVFLYPALDRTFAELSAEEKNRVSHRALALRRLMEQVALSAGRE